MKNFKLLARLINFLYTPQKVNKKLQRHKISKKPKAKSPHKKFLILIIDLLEVYLLKNSLACHCAYTF